MILIRLIFVFFLISCFPRINYKDQGNDTRIIVDQIGREIKVTRDINKIVTTYGPATSFIFQLGAHEKLVGKNYNRVAFKIFPKLADNFDDLISTSSRKTLNVESIANLKPDIVILFSLNEGLNFAKKFDLLNIPSFIIDPESGLKIEETLVVLGDLLGKQEKARQIINKLKQLLSMISEKDNLIKEKKRVYFASSSDFYSTYTDKMLQGSIIELANCDNVAKVANGAQIKVSMEQLVKWNPDLIVFSSGTLYLTDSFLMDKRLMALKAVSKKNIFKMPANLEPFDYPSATYVLGVIWLAQKAYPHIYAFNLKEIYNDFYMLLYGKTFDDLGGEFE